MTRALVTFATAVAGDAAEIAALRTAANDALTAAHGKGHWSNAAREPTVRRGIERARVLIARRGNAIAGTLTLETKKPWAIDRAYFTAAKRPLYLVNMAVSPAFQRQGIGRALLEHAADVTRAWPADAIWLDAYDAPAGAGGFYASCGYREVGRAAYRGVPLAYFELRL